MEITRQRIDVDWWHQSRDVFNTRVSITGATLSGGGDIHAATVRLVSREPFCREPYQSEIRKGRNPRPIVRQAEIEYIPGVATLITECTHPEYDILFEARPICSCVQGMRRGICGEYWVGPRVEWVEILWDLFFFLSLSFSFLIWKNYGGCNWGWFYYLFFLDSVNNCVIMIIKFSNGNIWMCWILKFWEKLEN